MKLEFDILPSEIGPFRGMKIREYHLEYQLLASIKQINTSDTTMMLFHSNFFIDENYEIINLNKEHQDSLRGETHYSLLFNTDYDLIKPNEFLIDTFNLTSEFLFYKTKPDTFLIRVKRRYDQDMIYSNWDTLIVR